MRYPLGILCFCLFLLFTNEWQMLAFNSFQQPPSERQFEADFKERYTGRKYNYEGKEVVNNELNPVNGEASKYQNVDPNLKEDNNYNESSFDLSLLNYLFILALVLAVIYLVYILFNDGTSGLFSSRRSQKLASFGDISVDSIEHIDVQALINEAESKNDYRLAIRYYYLLVLKTLSLKNYIKLEDDKTNAEYLNEIAQTHFSQGFAYTSYLYNYIWYGEFPLNNQQYAIAKQRFTNLLKDVK
ncbi:hypothetical protein ACFO5O_01560 [Geojedonia litorea]|uniref:DUF4129 domain-containing protein n=1 Tax=Geojedonia litorea TaxID=1268269 RepID=A0ABV9MYC9_9FLAO